MKLFPRKRHTSVETDPELRAAFDEPKMWSTSSTTTLSAEPSPKAVLTIPSTTTAERSPERRSPSTLRPGRTRAEIETVQETTFDVVGVGNTIVDVISNVDDDFVRTHGLNKGAMTLIDQARAIELYAAMPPGIEASGGSAANTMAGLASFGGRAAYIGKCRDDQLGDVFRHDIRASGVTYDVSLAAAGPPTARCLIQVTPDAQRTMNTFLGISALLSPDDVDAALVESAQVVYCEGYLWDVDIAKEAIRKAMDIAKGAGRKVALTLSDSFCVDRHRGRVAGPHPRQGRHRVRQRGRTVRALRVRLDERGAPDHDRRHDRMPYA